METFEKILDETNKFLDDMDLFKIKLPPKGEELLDFVEKFLGIKHRWALAFAHYNYQVENGGHIQYIDNRYVEEIETLFNAISFYYQIEKSNEVNEMYNILIEFEKLGIPEDYDSEEEVEIECPDCRGDGEQPDTEGELCKCCDGKGYIIETETYDGWEEFHELSEPLDKRYYRIENRLEIFDDILNKAEEYMVLCYLD